MCSLVETTHPSMLVNPGCKGFFGKGTAYHPIAGLTEYGHAEVFKALRANQKDFELDPKKIFAGQDHTAKVMQVQKFLAALPTAKLPLVPATARCYDTETIAAIEAHVTP